MRPITVYFQYQSTDSFQQIFSENDRIFYTQEHKYIENIYPYNLPFKTADLKDIIMKCHTDYLLFCFSSFPIQFGEYALERMLQVAQATSGAIVYSNYITEKEGISSLHPVIDYQTGSLRDDFDFGSIILYRVDLLKKIVCELDISYQYACFYDLRLRLSRLGDIVRIPEYLYTISESQTGNTGEKQFEYVDPRNRARQIEMEHACTAHLKEIGAWLPPVRQSIDLNTHHFPVEASIIIPVKNRIKTVAEAVKSALKQCTNFNFNIIVVDNHSTDGTTEILHELAITNPQVIHCIPDLKGLGIGGCWNVAIMHDKCGKFAIQLDSDDLYIDENVLQHIVNAFYTENCAMLIGSYQMVNFKLEEIPPGVIDHREWTAENGLNNALRINGLGAPRAFYTPVLRQIKFPDVSYGEDYAVGLAISRTYRIGRIYEPLYLCRRWEENSDANPDIAKLNAYNFYKDKIRSFEVMARKQNH